VISRRFLFRCLLGFSVSRLSCARAPLRVFTQSDAASIELLGEQIVPGSKSAGLARYLDSQLAARPHDSLLAAKYFEVPQPYLSFYLAGIEALQSAARQHFNVRIEQLGPAQWQSLLTGMAHPAGGAPTGYPIALFYLCLRSDAVDLVYGTPAGFRALNLSYREHIFPPEPWNG